MHLPPRRWPARQYPNHHTSHERIRGIKVFFQIQIQASASPLYQGTYVEILSPIKILPPQMRRWGRHLGSFGVINLKKISPEDVASSRSGKGGRYLPFPDPGPDLVLVSAQYQRTYVENDFHNYRSIFLLERLSTINHFTAFSRHNFFLQVDFCAIVQDPK